MLLTPNEISSIQQAGGKGFRLKQLMDAGFTVPAFLVVPADCFQKQIEAAADKPGCIQSLQFPADWKNKIEKHIPGAKEKWFAVRSSGISEDGTQFSFAGQFKTKLYVSFNDLEEAVREVLLSAFSETITAYTKQHGMQSPQTIAVVIQEMVHAEVSGVGFGINPVNGSSDEKIISSVFGLGEGIVSGELNADHFIYNGTSVKREIVSKTHFLTHTGNGVIEKRNVDTNRQNISSLNNEQLKQIAQILDKLKVLHGTAQDIEFSYANNQLYLLQTRPVTAANQKDVSQYIVWDNSNIIESYPGVTTPLTFSFILSSYEGAYRLFSAYLGVSDKVIEQNKEVYANTLGLINGRVYYNLRSWYLMLALLPGYSINARYMEKMMGVKEKFDVPASYRLSKTKAWLSIVKMIFKMTRRYMGMAKSRKRFMELLNTTISEYKSVDYSKKTPAQTVELYLSFEKTLLNEWKAPLLNDFFAMIAFGRLQKKCEKYGLNKTNPNIHNDLLCGSSDIISVQPIHRTIAIASLVAADSELKEFILRNTENEIWRQLSSGKHSELKKHIDAYIADFGERCIGELKLETVSYTSNPALFIRVVKSYVEGNITQKTVSGNVEEKLRTDAEAHVRSVLKYRFWRYRKFKKAVAKARELVSNRENLRYERTRAFGIVREIFTQTGEKFYQLGLIQNPRDIFYLTKEEIISFSKGTSVGTDLKSIIAARKNEFEKYQTLPVPSERIKTYGLVHDKNDFYESVPLENSGDGLKGIGCCPGRVKGKVRVVLNPREIHSLEGDILVTSSTDPGWVTLFPTAAAIIVERGSLLSHSAIVSREMGIPCIVGVTGLLKTLHTDDEIEMDGSTGEIRILKYQ